MLSIGGVIAGDEKVNNSRNSLPDPSALRPYFYFCLKLLVRLAQRVSL
jgi:hypothetical protein